ncbi:PilZ domain-containing protein [Bradyrhizobium genosp. SA-3]|nr:PilZ domain-containing protein [Bradyrhizobium genosp. SA-3]
MFGDGSSIRCRVVNLSDQGAAIELRDASLARPLELMLERDRSVRKCRLVWAMQNRIGVSFDAAPSHADVDNVDHQ